MVTLVVNIVKSAVAVAVAILHIDHVVGAVGALLCFGISSWHDGDLLGAVKDGMSFRRYLPISCHFWERSSVVHAVSEGGSKKEIR